jgi:hypothetical protein
MIWSWPGVLIKSLIYAKKFNFRYKVRIGFKSFPGEEGKITLEWGKGLVLGVTWHPWPT